MRTRRREGGYALFTILFMAAVLLILLGTAVPRLLTVGQREKEEELIFRGEQYARAVRLYYRKYGRFPTELDDLVKINNNVRFLRKFYPDPMNPNGKWRLIRVGPAGQLLGSVVQRPPMKVPLQSPPVRSGTPPTTMPSGAELPAPQPPAPPAPPPKEEQPPPSETPPTGRWPLPPGYTQPSTATPGTEGQPGTGQTQSPNVQGFPGGSIPAQPPAGQPTGAAKPSPGEEERPGFNPEEDTSAARSEERPSVETPPQPAKAEGPAKPASPEAEPQVFGAGIVGVASSSTRLSIRVYHGRQQYNEWEFIYDPSAEGGYGALIPGQPGVQLPGGATPIRQTPIMQPPGRGFPFDRPTKQ